MDATLFGRDSKMSKRAANVSPGAGNTHQPIPGRQTRQKKGCPKAAF